VAEMDAVHFHGHAGKFTRHPVKGHTYAMVLFYNAYTSPVLMSEYQVVGRSVAADEAAKKQLMVARLNGDLEKNKALLQNFNLKPETLPFIGWLIKDDQDWEHRPIRGAPELLSLINDDLKTSLSIGKEDIKVHELTANHFGGHAGKFTSHPVRGHYYALVLFYDGKSDQNILANYQVAARAVATQPLGNKIMMGQLNVETEENKVMVERFQLEELPFMAWLKKGEENWDRIMETDADPLLARINTTLTEAQGASTKKDEL